MLGKKIKILKEGGNNESICSTKEKGFESEQSSKPIEESELWYAITIKY